MYKLRLIPTRPNPIHSGEMHAVGWRAQLTEDAEGTVRDVDAWDASYDAPVPAGTPICHASVRACMSGSTLVEFHLEMHYVGDAPRLVRTRHQVMPPERRPLIPMRQGAQGGVR